MSAISRTRGLCLSGLVAACLSATAGSGSAGERQPFERSGDWQIERGVGDTGPNPCLMSRSDRVGDGKTETLIIFGLDRDRVILVLGQESWSFAKDEAVTVPLALGNKIIDAKSHWIGEGKLLKAAFPEKVVPELRAAERIELRFKDRKTAFAIPGFADAYDNLQRCDETNPPPAAAPAGEVRAKAFVGGLIAQATIKACNLAGAAPLKAQLDAKVGALQAEMGAQAASLRGFVEKRPVHCPPPAEAPAFQTMLKTFLDKSPEDFVAFMDTQAEKTPAAKP